MIRVLLADDHQLLLDSLQLMLEGEEGIECVGTASNGSEVMAFLAKAEADIILMDINMPHMDGMAATRLVRDKYPTTRIIALTMLDKGSFIQRMLKEGASGFLLKNSGRDEVVKAIRAVSAGGQYLGPEATNLLISNLQGMESARKSFMPQLTRREKEVLRLISQGKSTQQIGDVLHISFNTVESHRKNLRTKFGARNGAELVRMAVERGLLD